MLSKEEKHLMQFNLKKIKISQLLSSGTSPSIQRLADSKPPQSSVPASSSHLRKRKTSPSPSLLPPGSGKVIQDQPQRLALPDAIKSRATADQDFIVCEESPWDTFKKVYECDLADAVDVIVHWSDPTAVLELRQFSSQDADKMLERFCSVCHENLVQALKCFHTSDALYAVVEHYPLTLEHIVLCKAFPDEQQLGAILTQIIPPLFSLFISIQLGDVANT